MIAASSAAASAGRQSLEENLPAYSRDFVPRYSWNDNSDTRSIHSIAPSYHTVEARQGFTGSSADRSGNSAGQYPASLSQFAAPNSSCPFYTPQRKALDQIARRRQHTQQLGLLYSSIQLSQQNTSEGPSSQNKPEEADLTGSPFVDGPEREFARAQALADPALGRDPLLEDMRAWDHFIQQGGLARGS